VCEDETLKQFDEATIEILKTAEIGFEPVMGNSYYLYERENGTHFISLIAPTEWITEKQPNACQSFIVRLEAAPAGEWKVL
tara:strand:+ start:141 stop:383 length:243 start_codon:yes stop_codon:yes gene_type:complete